MLQAFQELVNPGSIRWMVDHHYGAAAQVLTTREAALAEVQTKLVNLLGQVIHFTGASGDVPALAAEICQDLEAALDLPGIEKIFPWPRSRPYKSAVQYLKAGNAQRPPLDAYDLEQWGTILVLVFSRKLGKILSADPAEYGEISRAWFDEWLLGKFTSKALQDMGVSDGRAERAILLIRLLVSQQGWNEPLNQEDGSLYQVLQNLFRDSGIQRFVGVNRYQELLWFNRESFEELLRWLYLQAVLDILASEREVAEKHPRPARKPLSPSIIRSSSCWKLKLPRAIKSSACWLPLKSSSDGRFRRADPRCGSAQGCAQRFARLTFPNAR